MENTMKQEVTGAPSYGSWVNSENLKLRGEQKATFGKLVDWLRDQRGDREPLAQCLLGFQSGITEPAVAMQNLVDQIVADFPRPMRDAALPILGRLVHHRNQVHHFQLPLPEIPVALPKLVPPFTPDRWGGLANYRLWSQALLDEIVNSQQEGNDCSAGDFAGSSVSATEGAREHRIKIGRVLASACLFGGLLCRKHLEDLYSALSRWTDLMEFAYGRAYFTWVDKAGNCRRWRLDAVTTLLLLQAKPGAQKKVSEGSTEIESPSIDEILMGYFRSAVEVVAQRPHSVHELIDSALLHYELRLPRYLTEYAAGKQSSTSANQRTWARMTGRKTAVTLCPEADLQPEADLASDPTEDNQPEASLTEPSRSSTGDEWVSDLRLLLGSRNPSLTRNMALRHLKSRISEANGKPTEKLFLAYAVHELNVVRGRGCVLKTIRDKVIEVAKRLPVLIMLEDAASFSADTLQGAYGLILDDAVSPNQHRKLCGYLRRFHRFLVFIRRSEKINEAEVFGSSSDIVPVDASVVLEDEYLKARDSLLTPSMDFGDHDPDARKELRHIAGLISILGYRAGLRRLEVLKLKSSDFCEGDPTELLVRPWEQRRLKTPNATRKIPLYALLTAFELKMLREWKARRIEQNKDVSRPSPFLFSIPSLDRAFVSDREIFPLIHSSLRAVTGDEKVHFHVLRHSGAGTWLAFALLKPPGALLPGWLDRWPEQKRWIETSAATHRRLYANDFATRRHLFAVAQVLGHSSPTVSVSNYLCLHGELLGMWLDGQAPELTPSQFRTLLGIAPDKTLKVPQKDFQTEAWKTAEKLWKKLQLELNSGAVLDQGSTQPEKQLSCRESSKVRATRDTLSLLRNLDAMLSLHAVDHASPEDLAMRFGFAEDFIQRLVLLAQQASGLQVSTVGNTDEAREPGYVHSFRSNAEGKRIHCPVAPVTHAQMRIIVRLAPAVFALVAKRHVQLTGMLKHYLGRRRNERNGLEFAWADRKLASQYGKFLIDIGVRPQECVIRHFGEAADSEVWFKHLPDVLIDHFEPARPPSTTKAAQNEIGMKVRPTSANSQNESPDQSSYGFRYLMLMASLWAEARHGAAAGDTISSVSEQKRTDLHDPPVFSRLGADLSTGNTGH